jgi:putative ABC transport system permease protein
VLYDLTSNKVRTLLVIASIAVGVFAIGVIVGAFVLISQDLSASYAAVNPANIDLITDPFAPDFADVIRDMDGIADVEGRRTATVRVRLGPDEWDLIDLVAIPDLDASHIEVLHYPQVNQLLPLQGTDSAAGLVTVQDREAILERKTMELLGVTAGDMLEIELADGTLKQIRVAGSAQEPTVGYGGILGDLKGFITVDTLEWLGYPFSLNRLVITLTDQPDDKAHIEQTAVAITDRLEKSGREVYHTELSQKNHHPLASILQALLSVLVILGVLVLFLSGALISSTMSALLNQHVRQIGVMKLVGARQSQVVGMYLTLIAVFGLLAMLIAVPLGGWGAFALSEMTADIINFVLRDPPPIPVVPLAVVVQVIVGLLVPLGAGMLPVLKGSRTTVQKALTSTGLGSDEEGKSRIKEWTDRMRWVSRPLQISLRNTFRRKSRLILTLVTLTLGGAIFVAVFNTRVALDLKVAESTKYFQADVNLDFAMPYRIEQVRREAMSVDGVERVEVWTSARAELEVEGQDRTDSVGILAPPADSSLIDPTLLEGRWLTPGDENALVVNEAFWTEYPDLTVGDVLRLEIAGKQDEWTIVGVFQYTGVDSLIAYANYDYLARDLGQLHRASLYRIVTADHSLDFQTYVSSLLQRRFKALGYRISSVESGAAAASSITDVLHILIVVLLAMALLTALVGSIGLAGTMSMNVLERTREIGVLRAIGAHNQIISKLVIVEGLIIGLISYLLGFALSFPITSLLSNVISRSIFNSPATFVMAVQGLGIWLALVLLLSTGASLLPARNATQLTIREVLAYE